MQLPFTIPTGIPISWYIILALTLTSVVSGLGWSSTYKTLTKERAQHELVVQQFKATQKDANAKAEAKRVELEKEGIENAKKADQRYSSLLSEYRANLVRFKANQGSRSRPNSDQLQPTQGGNGPSGSTELLEITMDDAQICAVNTARLQAVREWALDPPH